MKIRWPFVTQRRDDDMSREMAFHIESTTRELVRGGMSERDARLEARRRFGSVLKQKEAGHEIRVGRILEDILRDARFMSRGLRRSAGFTIAVVLTLAQQDDRHRDLTYNERLTDPRRMRHTRAARSQRGGRARTTRVRRQRPAAARVQPLTALRQE